MFTRLQARLQRLAKKLGLRNDWYLIALSAGIGSFTAVGSVGFMLALRWTEGRVELFHESAGWQWWLFPLVPMAGALAAGLLIYFFAPEAKGHGVPEVMDALFRQRGRIRPQVGLIKSLASGFTIGSGGSAGAEGPIVQIGAAIGSGVAQMLKISRDHTGTLLGCGAAAGIASVFNAPIAGVFFVLEILLRDFSLRTFTPIVVSSVFSTAVTQALLGTNQALFAPYTELQHFVFTLRELPSYVILGLLCGVVAVAFTRMLYAAEDLADRIKVHPVLKPVIGGALLGLLGAGFLAIERGAGIQPHLPAFFGNGYETIRQLLQPANYITDAGAAAPDTTHLIGAATQPLVIWLLLLYLIAKPLATSMTLGSGGSGGIFAPALFLGATAGAIFGMTLQWMGLLPADSSPAAYALVGMAAVVAGSTHAPLTSILIVFELTRDVYVLLPIMLAAVMSTVTAQMLLRDSIYTLKLRRRGLLMGTAADMTILRRITADEVPSAPPIAVNPDDPITKVLDLYERHKISDVVVTDHENGYLGMLTAEDIRTALIAREAIPLLLVNELMRSDLPTISPDETLDRVLDKFSKFDVTSLALVQSAGPGELERVIGLLSRGRLMNRYQQALEEL